MYCMKCGAEIGDGARFCAKCGAEQGPVVQGPELGQPYPQSPEGQAPVAPETPHRPGKGLIALLLVVVFILSAAAGILIMRLTQRGPSMEDTFSDPALRKALLVYDEDGDGKLSEKEASRISNLTIGSDVHVVDGLQTLTNLRKIDTGERTAEWRRWDDLPEPDEDVAPDLIIVLPMPDDGPVKPIAENEGGKASKRDYEDAIERLGFEVVPGPTLPDRVKAEEPVRKGDMAAEFIRAWYDDWTFVDGHNTNNERTMYERCLPLIAQGTTLYDEFEGSIAPGGRYWRDFATCVQGDPTVEDLGNDTYRVTIAYVGAQNNVDQASYDLMIKNPDEDVWVVTLNDDGKVTGLEEEAVDIDAEEYTVHFTGADFVLPEAWWGKVDPVINETAGTDERMLHKGIPLLGWNRAAAEALDRFRESGEAGDYGDLSTETLPDGTTLIFGGANDGVVTVEIKDPEGREGYLWTFAYSDFHAEDFGMDADAVASCRQLQADAAGMSVDDPPNDVAYAYLRVCAQRLTMNDDA